MSSSPPPLPVIVVVVVVAGYAPIICLLSSVCAGGFIGSKHGPWLGLAAAIFFGAVGALVHAIATISFGVDHVISHKIRSQDIFYV